MAQVTMTQATSMLRALGWRVRSTGEQNQAVSAFQRGWNLGAALVIDGRVGPKTSAALSTSYARQRVGKTTASANFSFAEYACHCGGRFFSCRRIYVYRAHLRAMEVYRAKAGQNITVISGYRCEGHNKAVRGATFSQHRYGVASDVTYALNDTTVASLRVFSGIGRSRSTRRVRHVDSRSLGPRNTTRGTVTRPTIWDYSS